VLIDILKVIGPSLLILAGFYIYIDKKTEEKIEQFQRERALLEKLKENNENFTIEFEEENEFLNDIETYVRKNEDKYKPNSYENEKNTEFLKEEKVDLESINTYSYNMRKSYEIKGKKFEQIVKKYFEKQGYKVIDNSALKGKKDEGIDLIAIDEAKSEYLCIQCKNWEKRKINHNHIKQFLSDYILYLKKHKVEVIKYKKRKFILAIPDRILTKAAYARIKENVDIINYKIINNDI